MHFRSFINNIKYIWLVLLYLLSLGITFYKVDFSLLGALGPLTFAILLLFWFALLGRITYALLGTCFSLIIFQLMNLAKIYYFKSRLYFTDLYVALDDDNLDTLNQYWEMYIVIALVCLIILITFYLFKNTVKRAKKYRIISLFLCIILSMTGYQLTSIDKSMVKWQKTLPTGRGVLINLWMTLNGFKYTPLKYEGDPTIFLERSSNIKLLSQEQSVKPDIVIFLQESTVNRANFKKIGPFFPELSMFDPSHERVVAESLLRVQTAGGGTWLSEFSFATGLDTDDFIPNKYSVFYLVAPHIQQSFYQELKKNGYYTVLLTPMTKDNYNTREAYEAFGIDLILQPQDLGYEASMSDNLWHISSDEMLVYAEKILKERTDKPVALFLLSMREHGSYNDSYEDKYSLEPLLGDRAMAGRISDYADRQFDLNVATEKFSDKILDREVPTVFLYFGDHQPALYGAFLRYDFPKNPLLVTQFVMRDNLRNANPIKIGELTDISFLGGLILERIGASLSPYYQANIKMRYLCNGKLADCEDQDLVDSYKNYIYNHLNVSG